MFDMLKNNVKVGDKLVNLKGDICKVVSINYKSRHPYLFRTEGSDCVIYSVSTGGCAPHLPSEYEIIGFQEVHEIAGFDMLKNNVKVGDTLIARKGFVCKVLSVNHGCQFPYLLRIIDRYHDCSGTYLDYLVTNEGRNTWRDSGLDIVGFADAVNKPESNKPEIDVIVVSSTGQRNSGKIGSVDITGFTNSKEQSLPEKQMLLSTDPKERKQTPITSGVLDYFPLAIAEVAKLSMAGNEQHNPGQPLHWDKSKSTDHADCIARHLIDRDSYDTDGIRHSVKLAWRALAYLQIQLENEAKDKQ